MFNFCPTCYRSKCRTILNWALFVCLIVSINLMRRKLFRFMKMQRFKKIVTIMHSHHITFSKLHLKTARQSYLLKTFNQEPKYVHWQGVWSLECWESWYFRISWSKGEAVHWPVHCSDGVFSLAESDQYWASTLGFTTSSKYIMFVVCIIYVFAKSNVHVGKIPRIIGTFLPFKIHKLSRTDLVPFQLWNIN